MNFKVAVYITAYLDELALKNCLQGILEQTYKIEAIFILDNSPNAIARYQDDFIFVNHQPSNIGIGAGLKMAINWSLEKDYDFLWTFDQDSIPEKDCLNNLLKVYQERSNQDYKIGIIAANALDLRNNKIVQPANFESDRFVGYQPGNQEYPYECDAPITSGSLISLAAAEIVLPPLADLFIDGIDLHYGMEMKAKGFRNLIVPRALIYHNFGDPKLVKFFQRELTVHKYSALRHYYMCRNHTYLETRYARNWYLLTCTLRRIKFTIYSVIKIILYDRESTLTKVWGCLLGTYHGFQGKLGKLWQ